MNCRHLVILSLAACACFAGAQTSLPPEELAKVRMVLHSQHLKSEASLEYEVGGAVRNDSSWEVTEVEVEYQGKGQTPFYRTRFTTTSFVDERTGLAGNLLPHGRARAEATVAVPQGAQETFWTIVVSAKGYPGPDAQAMKGGLLADIARGNAAAVIPQLKDKKPEELSESAMGVDLMSLAAMGDSPELVRFFQKAGFKADAPNQAGRVPLQLAALLNASKSIEPLLKAGAKIDELDSEEDSPIWTAAKAGASEALLVLLKNGAKLDTIRPKGHTLLHYAAKDGCSYQALAALVRAGIPVNQKTEIGETPLMFAASFNNPDQIGYLVKLGADINAVNNNGTDAIHFASGKNAGGPECSRELIKHGARVNGRNRKGETPLMIAAAYNHVETIKVLVEGGADMTLGWESGATPLHITASSGYTDATKTLIELKAPLEARAKTGLTPLHYAAQKKRWKLVEILLQAGAKVGAVDDAGSTPLHEAVKAKDITTVRVLLKYHAPLEARDKDGLTPAALAQKLGEAQIASAIAQGG